MFWISLLWKNSLKFKIGEFVVTYCIELSRIKNVILTEVLKHWHN